MLRIGARSPNMSKIYELSSVLDAVVAATAKTMGMHCTHHEHVPYMGKILVHGCIETFKGQGLSH